MEIFTFTDSKYLTAGIIFFSKYKLLNKSEFHNFLIMKINIHTKFTK